MAVGQGMAGAEAASPRRRPRSRPWVERLAFLALIGVGAAYEFGLLGRGAQTCIIAADGRPVTVVASVRAANRLLNDMKERADNPKAVQFAQKVTLYAVPAARNRPVSELAALKALDRRLTLVVPSSGIYVNGKLFAALPTQQDAIDTLSLLLRALSPPDPDLTRAFKQSVRVQETKAPLDKVAASPYRVLNMIRDIMASKGTYTIKGGDTAWKIAQDYRTTVGALKRANPNVDFARIREGDKVALPGGNSPITVISWKEVTQPVGDPSRNLTETVRITYENGTKIGQDIVRRPPRQDAYTGHTRRYRRHRRSRHATAFGSDSSSGLSGDASTYRRRSSRHRTPTRSTESTDTTAFPAPE